MTPAALTREEILANGLEDMHEMLYKIAHLFLRGNSNLGLDFQEVMSEVYLWYIRAVDKYTPERGIPLNQWVWLRVNFCMRETKRVALRQKGRAFPNMPGDVEFLERPRFDVGRFCRDLSDDARQMVQVLCEQPAGFVVNDQRQSRRACVFALGRYFKDAGWTLAQFRNCFRELKEAMR